MDKAIRSATSPIIKAQEVGTRASPTHSAAGQVPASQVGLPGRGVSETTELSELIRFTSSDLSYVSLVPMVCIRSSYAKAPPLALP